MNVYRKKFHKNMVILSVKKLSFLVIIKNFSARSLKNKKRYNKYWNEKVIWIIENNYRLLKCSFQDNFSLIM